MKRREVNQAQLDMSKCLELEAASALLDLSGSMEGQSKKECGTC